MEYVKYDPYNPEFNYERLVGWLEENVPEDQTYELITYYTDCIEKVDSIYEPRIDIDIGLFPEYALKLDDYTVPLGVYLVVLPSGKLSFILEDVMEELIFGA